MIPIGKKNDPIGDGLGALLTGLGTVLKNAWYGLKNLDGIPKKLLLGATVALCAAAVLLRRQFWGLETLFGQPAHPILKILLLGLAMAAPVIYLNIVAGVRQDHPEVFEEIGFLGKRGQPPRCRVRIRRPRSSCRGPDPAGRSAARDRIHWSRSRRRRAGQARG